MLNQRQYKKFNNILKYFGEKNKIFYLKKNDF